MFRLVSFADGKPGDDKKFLKTINEHGYDMELTYVLPDVWGRL